MRSKSLKPNTYLEFSLISKSQQKKGTLHFFESMDIPIRELALSEHQGKFKASYFTQSLRQMNQLKNYFQKSKLKGIRILEKCLEPKDWRDKWMESYHATPIGKRLLIVPEWEKEKKLPKNRIPVLLNPGSAFGSGTHETTRFILRLIESRLREGMSFLDLGTGTGILSAAASKLGVSEVLAIDNDASSIPYAVANFKLNRGLQGTFLALDLKRFRCPHPFDFVAANLNSKILLQHKNKILKTIKNNGFLAVTGILARDHQDFLSKFDSPRLSLKASLKGRRWAAFLFQKTNV